jgi:hypothetical protein
MEIRVSPPRLAGALMASATVLTVVYVLNRVGERVTRLAVFRFLGPVVSLETDSSLPTWYAALTLALCAGLLALIARAKFSARDKFLRHWAGLALLFTAMSVDEVARLHETLGEVLRVEVTGDLTGYFYHGWVILGIVFVAVVGLIYLPFVWRLPARTRWLVVAAGTVYVGGALGFELIAAKAAYDALGGLPDRTFVLVVVQHYLEMLGVALFAYALADYAVQAVGPIAMRFVAGQRER